MTPRAKLAIRNELKGWLRREPRKWWDEHADTFAELSNDEARAVSKLLRRGDTVGAYKVMLLRSELETWRAERHTTTTHLIGVARRRAEMREALLDLGKRAAKLIGRIVTRVLGI